LVGDLAHAAGALGDVLAGHLQMHTAGIGAFGLMHLEEAAHFLDDEIEGPRLVATRRGDGVAVHRVARPDDAAAFTLHGADQGRQGIADLVGAHADDQRQPPGLVVRIEDVDQAQQVVRLARRPALEPERILDAARVFDVRMIELTGAVADPQHVARGRVPVAGRGIDARERLLEAEKQRLVTGVEIGRAQLGMALKVEAASLHELERFADAIGQFDVTARLRTVLDEAQHPLAHAGEIGVAALRKGAQQVQRGRRLAIGLDLPARVGHARLGREGGVVDDVAAIAWQLDAVALLDRRGARLGELAGDAADLHHRQRGRISEHDRHLQEHAEEVADVVGAVLGEALGAVAALQQESLAVGNAGELLFQAASLAGENQRRKGRELLLDVVEGPKVRVLGNLLDRLLAPAIGRPTLGHFSVLQRLRAALYTTPAHRYHNFSRSNAGPTRPPGAARSWPFRA